MKNLEFLVLSVATFVAVSNAPADSEKAKASFLSGQWKFEDQSYGIVMWLNSDGSFRSETYPKATKDAYIKTGRYSVTSQKLTTSYKLRDYDLTWFKNPDHYVASRKDRFHIKHSNLVFTSYVVYFKSKDGLETGLINRKGGQPTVAFKKSR